MNKDLFDLSGRVALVTGASKGLGKSVVAALASAGADVALYARNKQDLENVKSSVQALGRKAEAFCVDVLDKAQIDENLKATLDCFGHIDILVNNAGVNIRKPVLEISLGKRN